MSRIKERVFLMLLLSILRARMLSLLAKPTHKEKRQIRTHAHTRARAVKNAQEQERTQKRKSVDDGGGGLTTPRQQEETSEQKKTTKSGYLMLLFDEHHNNNNKAK